MENQEIGEVILKIYEEQKKTNEIINGMGKEINGMGKEIKGMGKEIKGMKKEINGMGKEIKRIDERLNGLEEKVDVGFKELANEIKKVNIRVDNLELEGKDTREIIKIMQEEIRRLGKDIAVIQQEHGKKLDMLFDAVTGNEERNKEIQERLNNVEKILEKHSSQIYYLEKRA